MRTTAKHISAIMTAFAVISIAGIRTGSAQDTRFTQEYNAPLRLNPALMGPNTHLKALVNYRSQWGSIDNGYTTYRFTFLYPLLMTDDQGKLNAGLSVINDVAGAFTTLNISVALGYSLNFADDHFLSAAIMGGFGQKTLDAAGLIYDEQYVLGSFDENNPTNETLWNENRSYPDLGFGLLWYMDPVNDLSPFAGFSVAHINAPDESIRGEEADFPALYHFHGGVKTTGDKFDFKPNVRLSFQEGAQEYAIGTYADFKLNETMAINSGLWYRYRNQNAFALMLGFTHEYFLIAYSYDLASFELMKTIKGATTHEITLGYTLNRSSDEASKPAF